jgi:hypothetical protein
MRKVDETPPTPDPKFSAEFEAFDRDGYLILDLGLPEEVLDGAVADLDGEHYDGPAGPFTRRDHVRIQDAWRTSQNVLDIATAPRALDTLRGLYGREPKPFQTLNFAIGTEDSAHSDALHFSSVPEGFMCGVWVALEDIDMDNGPLFYFPGSHKLPMVRMSDVGAGPHADEYSKYSSHQREMIEREQLQPEYATIKKGQALIWASNLLHGGSKQQDPDRTRLSQVTHYFFEGCRYYTPLLSDERRTYWRDPDWVG